MSPAVAVFRELRALGVALSIDRNGRLMFDAPEGSVAESVMALIRSHRDELLRLVRSEQVDAPEPMPRGVICPWCRGNRLVDAPDGLRCWDCRRIAWVRRGRSIIRADCLKIDLEI
jgi:hypothetical protein